MITSPWVKRAGEVVLEKAEKVVNKKIEKPLECPVTPTSKITVVSSSSVKMTRRVSLPHQALAHRARGKPSQPERSNFLKVLGLLNPSRVRLPTEPMFWKTTTEKSKKRKRTKRRSTRLQGLTKISSFWPLHSNQRGVMMADKIVWASSLKISLPSNSQRIPRCLR